jgi:hypothetical protein
MRSAAHAEARILVIVHERGRILLEHLPSCLPDLTWNQVFLGVDALSRQGAIRLQRRGFVYEVRNCSLASGTDNSELNVLPPIASAERPPRLAAD